MARESQVSIEIYRRHIRLFRYINDTWIFIELIRPDLERQADKLRNSKSKVKKRYTVPKGSSTVQSKRRDADIGQVYSAQYQRGIYETNIVSMVSRAEAFLQDAVSIVACAYPKKLALLADKGGIPLDLFLESERREDVIRRYVALRCEGLMFGKPSEYLEKAAKVLSIDIDPDIAKAFIEIKASRDIIIHNSGQINKLYVEKAGDQRRGEAGEELVIDRSYFRHVVVTIKKLSGLVQKRTEDVYQ